MTKSGSHVSRKLLLGSTWMVAMRFGIRGIGLISTVILARLLTPADFGVVAMAMLVINFIEVFGETGQALALIRHPNPQPAHYNTAWTMSILINSILTLIILAVAPFSDIYFNDPRIVPVIQILSLRVFLGGFVNIGVVNFRRDLDFSREFRFGVFRKLLTFGVTLSLAIYLRNYWALVAGVVVGHVLEVILSYVMHAYRPRLTLAKFSEFWSYSIWLLAGALGRFFVNRADGVVVAGVAPPSSVGQYTVGAELGALPITEIIDPVARGLFPNYAKVLSDPPALRDAYLQVLGVIATIAVAVGTGIALVAPELVAVMLGSKWTDTAPLIAWFAIEAAIMGICNSVLPIMDVTGHSRRSALQTWLRVAFYIPAMLWAANTGVLLNFAIAKVAISVILIPTFFMGLRQVLPTPWKMLIAAVWRPPCAAVVMAFAVHELEPIFSQVEPAALRLVAIAVVGAAVFTATQLSLWMIAGHPDGVERSVLGLARGLRRRFFGGPRNSDTAPPNPGE